MYKRLSIQLSEKKGDIIKYCENIKHHNYDSDTDILFILGGMVLLMNWLMVLCNMI